MPHFSLVALALLSLLSCLKSRGHGGVDIQENVTPPTVAKAINPTIAYLPPKPKVSGDELTATELVVQPVQIGTQQIVHLTVTPDVRADFLQLSICQDTSPSPLCFPKVDNAEVFIAPEHYFPNAPIGRSFVQVRACVKPENALDVSKLCGTWSKAPYFQAKENPDDAWKNAIAGVHDGLQKYLEPCTDLQSQINTYLTAHPDQAAGKDTYSILLQNFINMGEFTCAQLLQNNILTELTPPTDTGAGTDTDTLVATVPPDSTDVNTDSQIAENTNPTDDNTNVLVDTTPPVTPPESGGGGWSDAKIGVFTTGIGLIAIGAIVAAVYGKRLGNIPPGSVEMTPNPLYGGGTPRSFDNPLYGSVYSELSPDHIYESVLDNGYMEIASYDERSILQEEVAAAKQKLQELQNLKLNRSELNTDIEKFTEKNGNFEKAFGTSGDIKSDKEFLKKMMTQYNDVLIATDASTRNQLFDAHLESIKKSGHVTDGILNSDKIQFLQNLQEQFEKDIRLSGKAGMQGGAQMDSPSRELQRIAGLVDPNLDTKIKMAQSELSTLEVKFHSSLENNFVIRDSSPTPDWHSSFAARNSPIPAGGEPSPSKPVGSAESSRAKDVKVSSRSEIAGSLVGVGMILSGIIIAAVSATQMNLVGTTPDPQLQALQTAGQNAYEKAKDIHLEILGANLTLLQLKLNQLQGK